MADIVSVDVTVTNSWMKGTSLQWTPVKIEDLNINQISVKGMFNKHMNMSQTINDMMNTFEGFVRIFWLSIMIEKTTVLRDKPETPRMMSRREIKVNGVAEKVGVEVASLMMSS